MSEFEYEGAITNLANSTDIDPDRLKDAYRGREGVLKKRFADQQDGAAMGAAGVVGSAMGIITVVVTSAGLQAATAHNTIPPAAYAGGCFLVSAFLLALGAIETARAAGAWRET